MIIPKQQIAHTTARNLAEAGIIRPDEVELMEELCMEYTEKDLLSALLESHQLREDCPEPRYIIGHICLN